MYFQLLYDLAYLVIEYIYKDRYKIFYNILNDLFNDDAGSK